MLRPKARTASLSAITCVAALLFFGPTSATALPPPPPNPSEEQIAGAVDAKSGAQNAVADASAAVVAMDNQIQALNAQALAAADAYEVAQGQYELARVHQSQTADQLVVAGQNVVAAEDAVHRLAHDVYIQGSFALSDAVLMSADGPQDLIDRSTTLTLISESQREKVEGLQAAKVAQANADAAAKQAVLDTAEAEAEAKHLLDEMNVKVANAQQAMAGLQIQKAQLDQQLATAQNHLFMLEGQKQTYEQWLAQKQAEEAAAAKAAAEKAAAEAAAAQAAAAEAAAAAAAAQASAQAQAAAQAQAQAQAAAAAANRPAPVPPPPPAPAPAPAPAPSNGGGYSPAPAAAPQTSGQWARPAGGTFTSCFCARWGEFHYGIDIANGRGTPIYAAGNGTVARAGFANGFGNAVYIQHAGGWVTVYGHMDSIYVSVGQSVYAGQVIAGMGDQGQSTGVHLHFEATQGMYGTRVDPVPWLAQRGIYI